MLTFIFYLALSLTLTTMRLTLSLTHRISSMYLKGRLNISMYSRNRVQC